MVTCKMTAGSRSVQQRRVIQPRCHGKMFLLESLQDREGGGEEPSARKCQRQRLLPVSPASESQHAHNTALIACGEKVPLPRLELLNFAADGRLGGQVPIVSADTQLGRFPLFALLSILQFDNDSRHGNAAVPLCGFSPKRKMHLK